MIQPMLDPKVLRRPAWMLALAMLPFIATVATGAIGFIASGDLPLGVTFNQITPQIMEKIRLTWILLNLFVCIAGLNIAAAMIMLAYAARNTPARPWMLAVMGIYGLTSLNSVFGLILRLSVINFSERVLGENPTYVLGGWGGEFTYPLALLAILLMCVGLVTSGLLRKTGLVVGAITVLLFILALFPNIRGSIPPFVFGLLVTPLGIGLLIRERRAVVLMKAALPGK
jgi:hypothetical protein